MTFCQQCRTQPATLKRVGQVICPDCYNLAREDVPADTLKNWFRYVWTGEAK